MANLPNSSNGIVQASATAAESARRPALNFASFDEFFPFYLGEHSNKLNRWMHFVGTSGAMVLLLQALFTGVWSLALLAPVMGYGMAWIGHFFVEHNRPASFQYPLWSFMGDFKMYFYMLTGRV